MLALCGSARAAGSTGFEELEDRYGAVIGLYAIDLASSATVEHRADQRLSLCSTFKGYAAGRILQLSDTGKVDLNAGVPITAADIVAHSPVVEPAVGTQMALRDICAAALSQSDNAAGNIMLRTIGGPSAITDFARSIGDSQSRLDRWETELNDATPGDPRDTTTPRALATGYRALLAGNALSPASRDQLLRWMAASMTSAKRFRAAVPPGWTTADKTGTGDYGSTNDAGMLIGPKGERVALAVLARSRDEQQDAAPFDDAIAETVRLVLERLGHGQ